MQVSFPEGLLAWGGHREGGVSKLLSPEAGKPAGKVIKTGLVGKLEHWVDDLVNGLEVPKIILLVGGPGNGKTEVLEHVIRRLDDILRLDNGLVDEVRRLLPLPSGFNARKVTVNMAALAKGSLQFASLQVVQDATSSAQPDGQPRPPEELFIEELSECIETGDDAVYIACVNRGILAQALSRAYAGFPGGNKVIPLLEKVTSTVTMSPLRPSCWPLADFPRVGVWPMDVESLIEPIHEGERSPALAIFMEALSPDHWRDHSSCRAAMYCPFKANQESLSDMMILDGVLKILRCYELGTGKRWTFRDLFSLVANTIVGHESDFSIDGKLLSPCDWVKAHVDDLQDDTKQLDSAFALTSRLYQHSLFPAWPRSTSFFKNNQVDRVLKETAKAAYPPSLVFKVLDSLTQGTPTEVRKRIRGDMVELLDPAKASGPEVITEGGISLAAIEDLFSFSVAIGHARVKDCLSPQENLLLEWLSSCEKSLDEGNIKKTLVHEATVLRATLRGVACRLVKRSLAVKAGVSERSRTFKAYTDAIHDRVKLGQVRDVFYKLLNPSGFKVSLKTTYGQPVPPPAKDVILETENVAVTVAALQNDESKPRSFIPYLLLDGGKYSIPVTFGMFEALYAVNQALHEGCLSSEVLAMLEGSRAKLAGLLVNKELDSAKLVIGNTGLTLNISYGLLETHRGGNVFN